VYEAIAASTAVAALASSPAASSASDRLNCSLPAVTASSPNASRDSSTCARTAASISAGLPATCARCAIPCWTRQPTSAGRPSRSHNDCATSIIRWASGSRPRLASTFALSMYA